MCILFSRQKHPKVFFVAFNKLTFFNHVYTVNFIGHIYSIQLHMHSNRLYWF